MNDEIRKWFEENGQAVIVVSANHYLDSIYSIRTAEFEIIRRTYSGLKVPISALRVDGETTGVFVNLGGVARFREVNVLYSDDTMAIVEDQGNISGVLKLYDSVIVNGHNIENGKILD